MLVQVPPKGGQRIGRCLHVFGHLEEFAVCWATHYYRKVGVVADWSFQKFLPVSFGKQQIPRLNDKLANFTEPFLQFIKFIHEFAVERIRHNSSFLRVCRRGQKVFMFSTIHHRRFFDGALSF